MIHKARHASCSKASSLMIAMLLLAVMAKSFFPIGFMPSVNKQGYTEIVICSGMGQKVISVPSGEDPSENHTDDQSDKVCAFQVLLSAKAFTSPDLVIVPVSTFVQLALIAHPQEELISTTRLTFDARGPPSA